MIGKVQHDSFQSLRIQIDRPSDLSEPSFNFSFGSPAVSSLGESLPVGSDRDCPTGAARPQLNRSQSQTTPSPHSPVSPSGPQASSVGRYKTEMCRPFQEHGVCKYGDKCQFAHGDHEVRNVNRHPKYKTDLCRTYHSVGFCPYGPRCHFIHALDEMRTTPAPTPEKKSNGPVKQLPMFGGQGSAWSFPPNPEPNQTKSDGSPASMGSAVAQLNKYFNMNCSGRPILASSSGDSSRSGSFCSDVDSGSLPSGSPPPEGWTPNSPNDASRSLRLPIFNRLA